jgi:hypothetical protein
MLGVEVDMRDMRMGDRGMVMLVAVSGSQMFERARRLTPVGVTCQCSCWWTIASCLCWSNSCSATAHLLTVRALLR